MPRKPTCPLSHTDGVDRYFLEHRAKVLDIAAFLDRLDRCESVKDDFRIDALRESCIQVLLEENDGRSEKILNILSDLSKNLSKLRANRVHVALREKPWNDIHRSSHPHGLANDRRLRANGSCWVCCDYRACILGGI